MSEAGDDLVEPEILYEAGPCLAVAKPAGLLTQAPPGIDSLERRIKQYLKRREAKPGNVYLGVPHRLVTDSMVGALMQKGLVDRVIVGADRIARNGDAANKIGTYTVAVLARRHNVPFYVAAPLSTFDPSLASGEEIRAARVVSDARTLW